MEIKKEFLKIEKERFITFMDALMAIIMTITYRLPCFIQHAYHDLDVS